MPLVPLAATVTLPPEVMAEPAASEIVEVSSAIPTETAAWRFCWLVGEPCRAKFWLTLAVPLASVVASLLMVTSPVWVVIEAPLATFTVAVASVST